MLIRKADELHQAKAKLLEITNASEQLLKIYLELYKDLNDLYADFPNIYKTISRVVTLPTNEDAQNITSFNKELKQELKYLNDDNYLQQIIEGNSLEQQQIEFPQDIPNPITEEEAQESINSQNEEETEEEENSEDEDIDSDIDIDIDLDSEEEEEEETEENSDEEESEEENEVKE